MLTMNITTFLILLFIYNLLLWTLLYVFENRQEFKSLTIKLWTIIKPFMSWRLLICYVPFWFLATGWTYVVIAIGEGLIKKIAITYLAIMFLPFSEEKLITIPLSIWLYKKLFLRNGTNEDLENLKKLNIK